MTARREPERHATGAEASPGPSPSAESAGWRVFIVEDHPAVRDAYVTLIGTEPGLTVAGTAESAEEALVVLPDADADLVLVDVQLPKMNGLELVGRLRARDPQARILVVSAHEPEVYAARARSAGALGFVSKYDGPGALLSAVHGVLG